MVVLKASKVDGLLEQPQNACTNTIPQRILDQVNQIHQESPEICMQDPFEEAYLGIGMLFEAKHHAVYLIKIHEVICIKLKLWTTAR